MKKVFSILFALLILISGTQLTVSLHYCGGELADSKVSVFGHIATCGMESETDECTQPGSLMESNCCKNKVSVYAVDHNYSLSFTEFKTFSQILLQVFSIPEITSFYSQTSLLQTNNGESPPENYLASAVSLPKICVFRI